MIASMTVVLQNGQRYAAQNIQTLRKGWGSEYQTPVIVFECSGVLTIFPAEEVQSIEFNVVNLGPTA